MKKVLLIFLLGLSLPPAYAQMENPLKQGMQNTVTLSNGEVVYDLSGEWDAIYNNDYLGTNRDVVKITQKGNKFVGIKLIGSPFVDKGSETVKGELERDEFKSLYGYTLAHGWVLSKGQVSDQGNKIIIETPVKLHNITTVITLTRK